MLAWILMIGCTRVCGTVEVSTAGMGAELFDTDGDGYTNLTEQCGPDVGSFGLRRPDLGTTSLIFDANGVNGEMDFAITTWVLPAADATFYTEHLVEGGGVSGSTLAGTGLHLPSGDPADLYTLYELDPDASSLDFLEERPRRSVLDNEDEVEWRIRWDLSYGGGAQHWQGEDWIVIGDDVLIGDGFTPPPM